MAEELKKFLDNSQVATSYEFDLGLDPHCKVFAGQGGDPISIKLIPDLHGFDYEVNGETMDIENLQNLILSSKNLMTSDQADKTEQLTSVRKQR